MGLLSSSGQAGIPLLAVQQQEWSETPVSVSRRSKCEQVFSRLRVARLRLEAALRSRLRELGQQRLRLRLLWERRRLERSLKRLAGVLDATQLLERLRPVELGEPPL